ncbi:M20/M25/M40 family metallo-hydrolase [Kineococcus sp. LSe6-4]|uniref:M20/M25/M40 family metallo-hydrolase n=1 Tax=Kineococcus halophytocola TaxID=3234027 RepID=A0ABV4H537_9ACTN
MSTAPAPPAPAAPPTGPLDWLPGWWSQVHADPETGGREVRTAARTAAALSGAGCAVHEGLGGTGVVGLLRNGSGPTVLLRAELDALAVAGPDGTTGAHHACGHDLNLAALVGTAHVLAGRTDRWCGTLAVLAQPAEELLTGARAVLDAGLLELVGEPDVVLAQHAATLPAGTVAHAAPGPSGPHPRATAAGARGRVEFRGPGGHPGTTRGPDVGTLLAELVLALPGCAAGDGTVRAGRSEVGTAANVVPTHAVLELSVRADDEAARDRITVRTTARARSLASTLDGATAHVVWTSVPAVHADGPLTDRLEDAQRTAGLGVTRVPPLGAVEDVGLLARSRSGRRVPLAYWLFGGVEEARWVEALACGAPCVEARLGAAHTAAFALDPIPALRTGVRALLAASHSVFDHPHTPR